MLICVLLRTEQKATDLIKYKYVLTIYRWLDHNDISVIEENTFNGLPNLELL
jgi:hypothetical protein